MTAVGRVCSSGRDEGTGFTLAPRLAVTANHVARDGALSFAVGGRTIAVERVERAEALDVAVLRLAEDAPAALAVGDAQPDARWRVEARPRDNDPVLTGSITATRWRITNQGGHEVRGDAAVGRPGARLARRLLRRPRHLATRRRCGRRRARRAGAAAHAAAAGPAAGGRQRPLRDPDRGRARGLRARRRGAAIAAAGDGGGAAPDVVERVSGLRVSPSVEHWRDRDELRAELRACCSTASTA